MLEHLSGSGMNQYDNDIHTYYTRYVLGEEPNYCVNLMNAMDFGKEYEVNLGEGKYKGWDTQKECSYIIGGYKVYGLFDFYNESEGTIIEVKTRNRWWKTEEIQNSWQFRIYNYWCSYNGFKFIIHQFNKKEGEYKEEEINREDKTFEKDFIEKAQQIERFLNQFNIEIKHYSLDKDT